jgi:hypothetical protein
MDDPREHPRHIGLLYSWHTNEYVLPAWVLTLVVAGCALGALWLLRVLCFGRGPGRWAATVLGRFAARRAETGNGFNFPPVYAWHHRQVIRFQALYLLFIVCTCGVGLIIGAPFYIAWHMNARREAEAGGWPLLPIVGRWQPPPPVEHAAP